MRYPTYMTKNLSLIFVVIAMVTVSCKTKKATIQTPARQTETDNELTNIKKDLPENQVERTDEGIRFTFSSEILFPTNSSYLNASSTKSIADVTRVIKHQGDDRRILVEGHSDKTGTPEYNQWLSEKRAVSVKKYMASLGLDSNRISTIGAGDTKPIADNKTKEGRMINRRVEVTILKAN
ncbi:OmpA family protein [Pedobacter sp.]|uniref:OmpA family protein n=1 Tax=Pedobacter sp. TaxID=1411316 RepID=UPI003D7F33E1